MFGREGDDELYGGHGEDGMQGDQGTDKHFGGRDNDFIDAAVSETPATDAPDVVDCGSGYDTARVRPMDIVGENCEEVTVITS